MIEKSTRRFKTPGQLREWREKWRPVSLIDHTRNEPGKIFMVEVPLWRKESVQREFERVHRVPYGRLDLDGRQVRRVIE